jgi:hypothetical protein
LQSSLLSHQQEFHRPRKTSGIELVKINSTHHRSALAIAPIPHALMASGWQLNAIQQRRDFVPGKIENFDRHHAFFRQAEANSGFGA